MSPEDALRKLLELRVKHNSRGVAFASLLMGCGIQARSQGATIRDHRGRTYIDMFDAYGNQAFGYAHPRLVARLKDALDHGNTNSCKIFFDEAQIVLAEALSAATGHALPVSFLANGGAEAIDGALKLARARTRRPKFVVATQAFHGKTFAAMSAAQRPEYVELYAPLLPEFQAVPFGDLDAFEAAIDERTAGVLLEPVQAEGGIHGAPPAFWQGLREICTRRGALLLLDEMQTGLGRTGTLFAYQSLGITPDVVCLGKSLGGGLLPISALLTTAEHWSAVRTAPLSFGSSLGGNPIACAVAQEALAMVQEEGFLERVRAHAATLARRILELPSRFPSTVRAARSYGLLGGVELTDPARAGLALYRWNERGALSAFCLYDPTVLRLEPPLVIEPQALAAGLDALEGALADTDAYARASGPKAARESVLTVHRELPGAPDDVFRAALATGLCAWPLGRNEGRDVPEGTVVEATLDGVQLTWTERVVVDDARRTVRAEAAGGDFEILTYTWSFAPGAAASTSVVKLEMAWDVGTMDFEEVLRLRLRQSLEREARACLEALSGPLAARAAEPTFERSLGA